MLPGLPTRTVTFVLFGESWVVPAEAVALGSLPVCGRLPVALLEAVELAWFPWVTVSVLPPSPTRIETLPFSAPDWLAAASL
jgi:hypothetical protein